jgi:hypothetical protein
LTSSVSVAASNVSLQVFTWGRADYPIPVDPTVPLSVPDFCGNYFGYIAAKH